jgi:PPOX class probable F420-dependent enzyme
MLGEGSEFGARVSRRLREEMIVWLTTVTPSGAPLPRPVGFLWDGGDNVLVYSQSGARIRNIARNPKVTLNFDGDGQGGASSSCRAQLRWTNPVQVASRTQHGSPSTPRSEGARG